MPKNVPVICSQTDQTERTKREGEREREGREKEIDKERQKDRQNDRQTETQTKTQRERERQETCFLGFLGLKQRICFRNFPEFVWGGVL